MALRPHVQERIDDVWDKELVPDIAAYTWQVAERVLAEEVRKGFDPQPVVITDGTYRKDPRAVKPFGKIEFASRATLAEVVAWIYAEVVRRSPYLGTAPYIYRDSHVIMINGSAIIAGNGTDLRGLQALQDLKPSDKVVIVNTVPYARKIEGATARKSTGRGKRKALSRKAPSGVYRAVYAIAQRRFGRVAFIDYKMIKLDLGVKVWGEQGGKFEGRRGKGLHRFSAGQSGGKGRTRVLRDQVYPAIQISQGALVQAANAGN